MKLTCLPETFAVVRLPQREGVPPWALASPFFSVTRTHEELSVVCEEGLVPPGAKMERGWRALKVEGPLDFSLTGVLSSLTAPLAAAKISLFSLSTFDTDYLLVRAGALEAALAALRGAGFDVRA